jgi:hypothetical protein
MLMYELHSQFTLKYLDGAMRDAVGAEMLA